MGSEHVREGLSWVCYLEPEDPPTDCVCVVSSPGLLGWDPEEQEKESRIHAVFLLCCLSMRTNVATASSPFCYAFPVTDYSGICGEINPSVPRLLLSRVFHHRKSTRDG